MVTKERLYQLIDALPDESRTSAVRFLESLLEPPVVSGAAFFDAAPGQAVLRPDVSSINHIDELRGDFWPADEEPDAFVNAVRVWQHEDEASA